MQSLLSGVKVFTIVCIEQLFILNLADYTCHLLSRLAAAAALRVLFDFKCSATTATPLTTINNQHRATPNPTSTTINKPHQTTLMTRPTTVKILHQTTPNLPPTTINDGWWNNRRYCAKLKWSLRRNKLRHFNEKYEMIQCWQEQIWETHHRRGNDKKEMEMVVLT